MGFKGQNIVVLPKYNAVVTMTSMLSPNGGLRDAACLQIMRYMMSRIHPAGARQKAVARRRRRKRSALLDELQLAEDSKGVPGFAPTRPTRRNSRREMDALEGGPIAAPPSSFRRRQAARSKTSCAFSFSIRIPATEITARLVAAAKQAAARGTVIATATATRGVPYISTRAEAQIGGAIALEMLAERHATMTPRSSPRSAIPASSARANCSICRLSAWPKLRCSRLACWGGASPSSPSRARWVPGTRNASTCTA